MSLYKYFTFTPEGSDEPVFDAPELIEATAEELSRKLAYVGLVLVANELLKSMIKEPIKLLYENTIYSKECPFNSYQEDVRSRNSNEFEACLLYLRDFMEAIDSEDISIIQELREHRNDIAHNLVSVFSGLNITEQYQLMQRVDGVVFKISNYLTRIDIGADPQFQFVNWSTVQGHEYLLFKEILRKVKMLSEKEEGM